MIKLGCVFDMYSQPLIDFHRMRVIHRCGLYTGNYPKTKATVLHQQWIFGVLYKKNILFIIIHNYPLLCLKI